MTLNCYFRDYRDVAALLQVPIALVLLMTQALPVEKVVVRGAERTAVEEIVRVAALEPGTPVEKADVAAAAERLMATGWFERVNFRLQPGPDGVLVTFTVVERPPAEAVEEAPPPPRPRIATVTFSGNREAPSGRLWAVLRSVVEGREYEEEDFRHILDSLLRPVFAERGIWQVKFGPVRLTGEDPVHLSVPIEEGPVMTLGGVTLEGGDQQWVEEARFPLGLTANRRRIDEAMIRLRHRLARDGYLRPSFVTTERVEGNEVRMHLKLEPGTQFRFGELRIRGLAPEAEARARRLWTAPPGAPASPGTLELWIKAVFDARIPTGTGVRREFVHREDAPVVDIEVEFR